MLQLERFLLLRNQLAENTTELLQTLAKLKPQGLKGHYFKGITMVATMGPGVKIEKASVTGI